MTIKNDAATLRRIRVRKEDSAFAYCIFEASEGILSYSTLQHQKGDLFRDLELTIPLGFKEEAEGLLFSIKELWMQAPSN